MKKILLLLTVLCSLAVMVHAQTPESVSSCTPPSNLTVDHIAGTSALVSWTSNVYAGVPFSYYVEYAEQGTSSWTAEETTENNVMISSLQPQTTYEVRLIMECDGEYHDTLTTSFTTDCLLGGNFAIGNGSELSGDLPSHMIDSYAASQQIFTAEEMGAANILQSVSFDYHSQWYPQVTRNLSVYLMHTSESNPTTWLSTANAQPVFSGNVSFVEGWNQIAFTTPFEYNGTDNLALFVIDQTNVWDYDKEFRCHHSSTNTIYISRDGSSFNISTLASETSNSTNLRNNVKFGAACNNEVVCVAPNVLVSDLSGSFVTLSWAPGSDESSWIVEYKMATASSWTMAGTTDNTTFTISNLSASTDYQIRVTSDCGEEQRTPAMVSVTTPCSGITSLPFTEGFDEMSEGQNIPACWYSGSDANWDNPRYESWAGAGHLTFDGGTYGYLALPRMAENIDMNSLLITFEAGSTVQGNSIEVGVMTDPENFATFTPIAHIIPESQLALQEIITANYTGNGRYIAFSATGYMFLDNITISAAPSCYHVSNVTADNITPTTADIHWQIGANETDWDIVSGVHGTINPDDADFQGVTSNNVTIDVLPNTHYDVFVRANCGDEQSEWMSTSFWSGCEALTNLPYSANFDDVENASSWGGEENNLPNCWNYLNAGMGVYPVVINYPSASASGTNCVAFETYYSGDQYAILPELDAQIPVNMVSLMFDAKASYENFQLVVGVMSDPTLASTFVPVDTISTNSTTYNTYEVNLSSYEGEGQYIAIAAFDSEMGNEGYVDNVSLNYASDCARPMSLQANYVSTSEIELNWTSSDSEQSVWNVEYGPRGFMVGTGVGTTIPVYGEPTTTIYDLEDGIYDVYVQGDCGSDGQSPWFGPVAVCPNGYNMAQGEVETITTCSTYIFDNGGVAGNYANYSNDVLVVNPDQTGNVVRITGNYFLDNYGDVLSIYDGASVDGELLWTNTDNYSYSGTIDVRSTVGPLTIKFVSNANNSYEGYELLVSCESAVSCVRPANLAVSSVTTTSVGLEWVAYGQESQWIVEYGPQGFVPGNGTMVVANTNPYTIQNLTVNTAYDFYVRALCSAADTSDYSYAVSVSTPQNVAQTPYFSDFSNAQENAMWTLVNGNQTNKWYIGQPTGNTDNVLFVSNNGTSAEYSFDASSTVWAYRDIQFTQDMAEFEFSFNWKAQGESSLGITPYDYMRVYIGNPQEVIAGDLTNSEAGLLALSEKLNRSTSWQTFTTILDGSLYAGQTKRIYFVWKNDDRDGENPSAMIDSVSIREISCSTPTALALNTVTENSAVVSFVAAATSTNWQYVLSTSPVNPDGVTPVDINSATITLSNLTPETTYYLYVRTDCSNNNYSDWTSALTFTTEATAPIEECLAPSNLTVSEITQTSAMLLWTNGGDEEMWNVQYKLASAEDWSNSINVNTTSYALGNLVENKEYQVRVQAVCDENNTSDWTNAVTFTTQPDGVLNYELDAQISVFPNPTNGQFTINNAQCTMSSVDVYDVYGKLISTTKVEDTHVTLDINEYADGMYFVRIVTEDGVVTKRIVKK